jgi:hypothetical protein
MELASEFPYKPIESHDLPWYPEITEGSGIRKKGKDPDENLGRFHTGAAVLPKTRDPTRTA